MNIARRHRERELARKSAEIAANTDLSVAAGTDVDVPSGDGSSTPSDLMLIKLIDDRRRLKDIQSVAAKIELKRDVLLPEYQAWIDGLLSVSDQWPMGEPNDVLTTIMLWSIDAGDITRGLEIAHVVLSREIPLPSQFDRTPGTAIAEQIAEGAFAAIRDKTPFEIGWIIQAQNLTETQDMPDQVRAKLFKAEALLANRALAELDAAGDNPDGVAGEASALASAALLAAGQALSFDAGCGVTTLIRTMEKRLRKEQADQPSKADQS